ncbi:MAG: LytTR family DNA-binding domain-containing protein [Oscillospiraceae bacterium]
MRIAVCDDDPAELSRISSLLAEYQRERNVLLGFQTYQSAAELLSSMAHRQYDLLLLDIIMPGLSGIEAAHDVRNGDNEVSIIFLTSSPEFALESYEVKARDYMIKPISRDRLFPTLDELFAQEQTPFEGLLVKTKTGISRILFSHLAFLEATNRHLYFNMTDGSVREVSAALQDFTDTLLSRPEFIKTHRSYIVNLEQMDELTSTGFLAHTGALVPVSRPLYSGVRRVYMEHLFAEAGAQ